MIANWLRKAVLQSAVEGKLSVQLSDDGLAKLYIDNVLKERQKLIKSGIIRKEKSVSKIVPNDYDLPENWTVVRLGDISKFVTKQTGFDYSNTIKPNLTKTRNIDSLPYLQTKHFKWDSITYDTDYFIPNDIASLFPKLIMDEESLLLSIVGASIGNVHLYKSNKIAFLGGAICRVCVIDSCLLEYLKYYLNSPLGLKLIKKNETKTAQATVTVHSIRELPIMIPPLSEQKRIVDKLDEILPLIDSLEKDELKLNDLMQQFPNSMTSSILLQAMEGKLVDQYPEDGKAINELKQILKIDNTVSLENELDYSFPENWELIELEKVCDLSTGNSINETVKKTKYSKKINGYSYIGTKDVNFDHTIDYDNGVYIPYDDSFRVAKSGSTLLCIEGGSAGRKIGLLDRDVCYGNKLVSIFPLYINPKFVFYFVKSPIFQSQFKENMTGMIGGVGINKIKKIYIPIPPLTIQKRIVEKLDQILPIVEKIHYEKY